MIKCECCGRTGFVKLSNGPRGLLPPANRSPGLMTKAGHDYDTTSRGELATVLKLPTNFFIRLYILILSLPD